MRRKLDDYLQAVPAPTNTNPLVIAQVMRMHIQEGLQHDLPAFQWNGDEQNPDIALWVPEKPIFGNQACMVDAAIVALQFLQYANSKKPLHIDDLVNQQMIEARSKMNNSAVFVAEILHMDLSDFVREYIRSEGKNIGVDPLANFAFFVKGTTQFFWRILDSKINRMKQIQASKNAVSKTLSKP